MAAYTGIPGTGMPGMGELMVIAILLSAPVGIFLLAAAILLFVGGYVAFQRQEVRA